MEKYFELKQLVSTIENDILKFSQGNNAAGTRVRKGLQDVKSLAQAIRVQIQESKNKKESVN